MKRTVSFIVAIVLLIALAGCGPTAKLDLPFEYSGVETIEMFHFVVPMEAEKKVITEQADIQAIYELLEGISLQDKETEPVAGGSVTSLRFTLSDGTSYEVIYSAESANAGRIKTTGDEHDHFTSADIESVWESFDQEAVDAAEDELPALY